MRSTTLIDQNGHLVTVKAPEDQPANDPKEDTHHDFLTDHEVSNQYLAEVIYRLSTTRNDEGRYVLADYADLEPLFDTELRAITAHVLLPVGERATRHVFANTTAEPTESIDMDALHAKEVLGSGWLVYPIKEPAEWTDDDEVALVDALTALLETDYRREADLGRFMPGEDPYLVR